MNLRKLFKWGGITAISLFAAFMFVLIGFEFLVSDSYVAKLVTRFSKNWIDAEVKVEKINLATFSHFPYIGIELEDGHIVSKMDSIPSRADTLLAFDKFTLLFKPVKLLFKNVDIRGIMLESPRIYAYVTKEGKPNWDIFKLAEKEPTAKSDSLEKEFDFNINVKAIAIKDKGHFTFHSRIDRFLASLSLNSLELSGRFTNDLSKIYIGRGNFSKVNVAVAQSEVNKYLSKVADTKANRASMRFSIDTLNIGTLQKGRISFEARTRTNLRIAQSSIARNLPLDIQGEIHRSRKERQSFDIAECRINLAKIPILANGTISYNGNTLHTENFTAQVEEFPLSELLEYIPSVIVPDIKKIDTDTRISLDAKVYGNCNPSTGEMPSADISFKIPHSYICVKGQKEKIKDLYIDAAYHFRANNPDSNIVNIHKLGVDGDGIVIEGSGSISALADNPHIKMKMNSKINLDSLVRMLPPGTDIYGSGNIDADLQIDSRADNLTLYNIGKTNMKGSLSAKDVQFGLPSRKIYCNIFGGYIKANTKGLSFKVDSTYIRYADSLLVKGRKIELDAKNDKPFSGTIAANSFSLYGADSTHLRVSGAKAGFTLSPYEGDESIPSIKFNSSINRLMLRQDVNFASITNGAFEMEAHRNDMEVKIREERMARLTDSLQLLYPQIARDSLLSHWVKQLGNRRNRNTTPDSFTEEDYNFRLTDKGILYLLNRWDAKGKLDARRIRVASPLFPLRNRIDNPEIKFNLNTVSIEKAKIQSGHSSFAVSGEIKGIKGALARGSKIRTHLKVDADTLNFNELTQAISAGEEFMNKANSYKDSLMKAENEEVLENTIALKGTDTLSKMALIIIPRNIEATLDMNVKYGIYFSIILHSAKGKVISKERCLQITDFNATTSAGAMDLNAFYRTVSKDDLSVGFDLQFKDMNIGEFIRLYPGMDTLFPMLKSFEGIINCQMTATSQIDTNMNFKLPTIEGVAKIKGDSLVLLDGETFAEIAKMLKFKNRERNLVDSIAVEVTIKDNQLEVFPFIMKMDRYTTAISGVQDLDMNLDYHISVLKSPLPLRMGINITGNIEDFKFKVGKAKYKDTNLPVYSKFIDSSRVNLLERIKQIHKSTH